MEFDNDKLKKDIEEAFKDIKFPIYHDNGMVEFNDENGHIMMSAKLFHDAMVKEAQKPVTFEKHVIMCLGASGLKLSVRQFGRLVRTYNNTGVNMPISALVKEIAEGKRNDFYLVAEKLNKLCNGK